MTTEITIGMQVVLISGGPPMTVSRIEGDNCYCQWFYAGALNGELFPRAALQPHRSPGPSVVRGRARPDDTEW